MNIIIVFLYKIPSFIIDRYYFIVSIVHASPKWQQMLLNEY